MEGRVRVRKQETTGRDPKGNGQGSLAVWTLTLPQLKVPHATSPGSPHPPVELPVAPGFSDGCFLRSCFSPVPDLRADSTTMPADGLQVPTSLPDPTFY